MTLNTIIVTCDITLTASNELYILNDTIGTGGTITLPAGTDGMIITGVYASTNIGAFTLAPSGTDALDSTISYPHGSFVFKSGTWYLIA